LNGNRVACGLNPGGGGIVSFQPFVYLRDIDAVKAHVAGIRQHFRSLQFISSSSLIVKQLIIIINTVEIFQHIFCTSLYI